MNKEAVFGSPFYLEAALLPQCKRWQLMKRYDFPLWAGDSQRFPKAGLKGAGWKLIAIEAPFAEYGTEAWERHFAEMRKKYPQYSVHNVSNGIETWISPQLVVETKSRLAAQRIYQLLTAALTIIDGSSTFDLGEEIVIPRDRKDLEDLTSTDLLGLHQTSRNNVILGSRFAASLSRRKLLTYAAFKLTLSYKLASVHWMEMHPRYYPKAFGVSKSPFDHVLMASAITLAYSAIEELKLEPRPINSRPVKTEAGWDENARVNLHTRLQSAGVNISDPLQWIRRGSQTRVHKAKRAATGSRQPWTKGVVRDVSVAIEDALLEASWLRSKCTTHKYQKETSSISAYDVANVQILSRRLLLEVTGMWNPLLRIARQT